MNAEEEGLGFIETSKRLGEIWKTLTEEEKAPYIKKAKEDQERVASRKAELAEKAPVSKKESKREAISKQAPKEYGDNAEAPEAGTSTPNQKAASKKRKADKVRNLA